MYERGRDNGVATNRHGVHEERIDEEEQKGADSSSQGEPYAQGIKRRFWFRLGCLCHGASNVTGAGSQGGSRMVKVTLQ